MGRFYNILATVILLIISCNTTKTFIKPADKHLHYQGRVAYKKDAAELSWPGTSVTMNFYGTGVSATLKDSDTSNYYNVVVDDKVVKKIHTDTGKNSYELVTGLNAGAHTVQLFKRTEWDKGKTWFYGYQINNGGKALAAPVVKKRKIEFYGNSITCGYATEDNSGHDSPVGYYENNYVTYAASTARYFDAEYYCIGKSGIGITISWFPLIMREMYDRLDATDSTSKWDFSKYTPDVVVINLFQNDSWLINNLQHEQFKARFGTMKPNEEFLISSYKSFIQSIRTKYPNTSIICALGNMDATREGSPWPGYVQKAVEQLHDKKMYTHFFKYKNTGGHPKVNEQKAMAESLIAFIEKNIQW